MKRMNPSPLKMRENLSVTNMRFKRIAIVAAGPIFNLILALLIFCSFYVVAGIHVMTPEIGQVRENSPASRAGFLKSDIIVSVGNKKTDTWPEIKEVIQGNTGQPI